MAWGLIVGLAEFLRKIRWEERGDRILPKGKNVWGALENKVLEKRFGEGTGGEKEGEGNRRCGECVSG